MNIYRIWDKINPRNIYHYLKDGIGNLIYYFPEIWKQRDFDGNFIYTLLLCKMKRLQKRSGFWEKYFEEGFVGKRDINICVKLLEEIIEDDSLRYIPEDCFPKSHIGPFNEKGFGEFTLHWASPEKEKIYDEMAEKGDKRLKKVRHLLFKILEEKADWWWD